MILRRLLAALALLGLLALPAWAAQRKPVVIGSSGQQQQIQAADTLLVPAATTANASLNIPQGAAPTSPTNGDVWLTTAGMFAMVNGSTVGPFGSGGGTPGGSSGQVQCNSSSAFAGIAATDTQLLIAQSSGCPLGKTMSGDATISDLGALSLTLSVAHAWTGKLDLGGGGDLTPAATPSTTAVGYLGAPQNAQSASYTLVMGDAGHDVVITNASANTATIPPNSSVAFPIGAIVKLDCEGAGACTVTRGSGVTLRPDGSGVSQDVVIPQYAGATIWKIETNTWKLNGIVVAQVMAPGGRLTLSSGVPVMTANVTAATTIYYDNANGGLMPYYTGSSDAADVISGGEISNALKSSGTGVENASDVFDEFWDHAAGVICTATNGSGGGWAGDTGGSTAARGSGYSRLHNSRGYWTNFGTVTHCYNGATDEGPISADLLTYLGSFYTTAAGQTGVQFFPAAASGGSNPIVGLWNAYNQVPIDVTSIDTLSHGYTTGTWRAASASNSNRVTGIWGLVSSAPHVTFGEDINDNNNCAVPQIGIVEDSTSATPAVAGTWRACGFGSGQVMIGLAGALPQVGLHYFQAMELGGAGANFNGLALGALIGSWMY